ncbi:MAG: prepilin-type N-terminal cleavage/methylation domain-containing protein [Bdellovibrionaceae bacterium]|nr:prepilin-type N-terminal cleavage/methylation domain-containing protein [Pseudobdellovibrionaceae bacterium]
MMRRRGGFTLIEVLISVAILATLAMLASRTIQQAVRAKVTIQTQIDDISKMRDAMRLMERDVNLAFHHRDTEKELQDLLKKKENPGAVLPNPADPAAAQRQALLEQQQATRREAPRVDPATHFVGNAEGFSFVTMNNARMVRNSRQADFIEVGYSLKDCSSADGKRRSKCLWRRSSPVVDEDVTVGGDEVVLLEDVSEFSLQYIGKGKQDWVKEWRTDKGGDAVTKNNFPQAVEITLGVQKGDEKTRKKYKLNAVVPIHFPNNKEEESNAPANPGVPAATTPRN